MSRVEKGPIHADTHCTARRRSGEPCRNWAMLGSNVCRMHGGAAPQVRRRAQQRILEASDKLMAQLISIATDKTLPVQVRLVAIRDGLDRANLSGKQELEIALAPKKKYEFVLDDILIDVEEDDDHFDMGVIEAVVVDDADDVQRDVDIVERQRERAEAKRKNLVPPQRTLTPEQEAQQAEYERRVLAAEQPKRRGRATMTRR